MLNLETTLKLDKNLWLSPNLAGEFSESDLGAIGNWVYEGFKRDQQSRRAWSERSQKALDLAMQVSQTKSFPWPNCSNVAFPLVTIGALQFHSRAYPATTQVPTLVRYRVIGEDPQGEEAKRAERISKHMSYQLLEEDSAWEEQHDTCLLILPIVGSVFKKSYYSAERKCNISELVQAQDLVMDYYARSVEDCQRKTHIIPLYRNEMYSNMVSGVFRDCREEAWYQGTARPLQNQTTAHEDKRAGQTPPQGDEATPFTTLEQHCWIDLDRDGYAEPYAVTIELASKAVLRIVARFDDEQAIRRTPSGEVHSIVPTEYFTRYVFIPSPDGGIYGMGFGNLLGPLNESVNSVLNQLIDAGTMATTAGGFLGKGAKMRGGVYTFSPLEWKRVDSTGDDLRKSIFPLPVREPSNVLFQLLGLLIDYTNRVAGTTDTMVGENPGQNTPAATTQTMVEQGQKIYSAIFKRVWRSMKDEFRKLYKLNSVFLPVSQAFGEEGLKALRSDYLGATERLVPAVDPHVVSEQQRFQKAVALKQAAMTTPGYNLEAVERNYLSAMQIDGVEAFYPGPGKVPPLPNPKAQMEMAKIAVKEKDLKLREMMFIAELMEERRLNGAKIVELEAKAMAHMAEAKGVDAGHRIAAFEAALGALKHHDESLNKRIELMMKSMEKENDGQASNAPGMGGLAGAPSNQGSAQMGALPGLGV